MFETLRSLLFPPWGELTTQNDLSRGYWEQALYSLLEDMIGLYVSDRSFGGSFFKNFIHLREWVREREREHKPWGGAQGEGEADSPLSREPDLGLNTKTLGSWPEPKADAQPKATQHPRGVIFKDYAGFPEPKIAKHELKCLTAQFHTE